MTTAVFCFDTETLRTRPGCKAPPMACITWQTPAMAYPEILHGKDPKTRTLFEQAIRDPNVLCVGHFVAYDMGVCAAAYPDLLPAIFDAYLADRITDTMLREQLWDIAWGSFRGYADKDGVWRKNAYDLASVTRKRAGIPLKKDGWRKRYGEVLDLPLEQWPAYAATQKVAAQQLIAAGVKDADLEAVATGDPEEIIKYPLDDARGTLAAFLGQEEAARHCDPHPFADQFRQARASWWLTLMASWGLRTHPEGVKQLRAGTVAAIAELTDQLVETGLVRKDGSRDTKKAQARMLEVMGWRAIPGPGKKDVPTYEKLRPDARPLRKTKGGGVSLDRDACEESEDPILEDYGERAVLQAVLDKDVPMLEAGVVYPVHTRVGLAASGRTTTSAPNIQNLRRLVGIREAFIPREGMVYIQADYPGLELHTLGQACLDLLGHSSLAQMLNSGKDPHLAFAANALGISYEEAKKTKKTKRVDDMRQIGKVFNFGSPGGLGSNPRKDGSDPTLVTFARKTYGVVLTLDEVREYKRTWEATLPEMREFFAYVRRLCDNPKREATLMQLRSKRIRGGASFCAACNTWFQGLGADAAKDAGFYISKACYVDRSSPLFTSRIAAFIHDEFICETKDRPEAHEAALELAKVMQQRANVWVPDVPFFDGQIEPQIMRLWSKEAEPLYDANKRLVAWEPALGGLIKMGAAIKERVAA